jgi:hypothetical protein
MRENVLRKLARQAAADPDFLRQARKDLEGTLASYGHYLTDEEMRLVESLRQQTPAMSDKTLARTLARGLEGVPAAHPPVPLPRVGAVRVPRDRHDLEVDGGR